MKAENLIGKGKSPTNSKSESYVPVKLKPELNLSEDKLLCTLNLPNGNFLKIHDEQAFVILLEKLK